MSDDTADARRSIKFDGTISLGTVLTVISIVAGGVWFAGQSDAKLKNIDSSLTDVKASIDRLTIQTTNNIDRLDRRIDFLARQPSQAR